MTEKKPSANYTEDDKLPAWHRWEAKLQGCPFCHKITRKPPAKTCGSPKCVKAFNAEYNRGYYGKNAAKIIANQKVRIGSRATPPEEGYCEAPHPTKRGKLCGKKFEATGRGKGRRRTCSPECAKRLRNAQQVARYHKNPQAKRDYKNSHYAANYAQTPGTTRCPNPGCRRPYVKRRSNQHTCGRPSCHVWQYQISHHEEVNRKKREKRRGNPVHAAYQRDYRAKNPEKFKAYRLRINERQRQRRRAARQAAIAAGTFVDRRRKLTDSQKAKIVKRRRAGKTLKQIAKSFGIHFATVARI
ncbi:MAG: helix-turn-helix domain-containing protein, partial [Xanthobacteraceae bacterium]